MESYAVDIDLKNGEQPRGNDFAELHEATKFFNEFSEKGEYKGEEIENIQLLELCDCKHEHCCEGYTVLESKFFDEEI